MLSDGLSDSSTSTKVVPALDKEKTLSASISNDDETEAVEAQDASEYPKGTSLAFIVIALILSIFLCSLDTVGGPCPSYTVKIVTEFSRPLSPLQSPRLRTSSMALTRYHGTARPSS